MLSIEIIYATIKEQKILCLDVDDDCDVETAIKQSTILEKHPEIDLSTNKIGIFSRVCKLDEKLHDKDRIEIYRPLLIDPKEARKQRALKKKK